MSNRKVIGWFIRRTWIKPPHFGETLFAESHRIYPTEDAARAALTAKEHLDVRFRYDVAPVYMAIGDEP